MKISIGADEVKGPFGGGNTFLINFKKYFSSLNHEIVNNLEDDDIDIILLFSPLPNSENSTYDHLEIYKYLINKNHNAIVVQRINECDERKNTKGVNKLMIEASVFSDFTVFVSDWLKNLYIRQGLQKDNNMVILGGSDSKIFNFDNKIFWDGESKFKLVTHHWSSNWMKGFEVYKKLDNLLDNKLFSEKISFSYIGNIPKNFEFKNVELTPPLAGKELAQKLKEFDAYITGSINEPSGNHHVEGALCGLPILYLNSGGIPEYCKNYGIEYNFENLDEKIFELMDNYKSILKNMNKYDFTSNKTNELYLKLFEKLIADKITLINNRVRINKIKLFYLLLKKYFKVFKYNLIKLRSKIL